MSNFARGKYAQFISDRSGQAFPYKEMVTEWTGAKVHISEYEPKQPQLDPKPHGADPQGLQQARPARTEFPTADFLPDNPFSITSGNKIMTVSFPDYATDTSITLSAGDGSFYLPSLSYVVIEKVNSETGRYENEVVYYETATIHIATGIVTLNNCVRGTAAPFRGETFPNTTASSHLAGAKVFGCRLASTDPDTVVTGAQPATIEQYNRFTVNMLQNSTATATGGGFQCTIGPVNDRA